MSLTNLKPLPEIKYRLELSYFLPKFREELIKMWQDIAPYDILSVERAASSELKCINEYGKDLTYILGYIDPTSKEYKANILRTKQMLEVDSKLDYQFTVTVGANFTHTTHMLPLVYATKTYYQWQHMFEEAANRFYEGYNYGRSRSSKDHR
jgi:hypothetical protein